jgi:predicted dehydrogenase
MSLRVGIVGVNRQTPLYLAACVRSACVSQVVLTEPSASVREPLVHSYGIIKRASSNLEDVFTDDDVDLIIPCLPHSEREPLIREALRRHKHVLSPGLPALNTSGVESLLSEAGECQCRLSFISPSRFLPAVRKAKELLVEETLGEPLLLSIFQTIPTVYGEQFPDEWAQAQIQTDLLDSLFDAVDLSHYLMGASRATAANSTLTSAETPGGVLLADLRFGGQALGQLALVLGMEEVAKVAERRLVCQDGMLLLRDNPIDELPLLCWHDAEPVPLRIANPLDVREYSVLHSLLSALRVVDQQTEDHASSEDSREVLDTTLQVVAATERAGSDNLDQPTA